jgi:hypothetical protein
MIQIKGGFVSVFSWVFGCLVLAGLFGLFSLFLFCSSLLNEVETI